MAKRKASSHDVRDLKCSVCMEIFTEPKLLPCYHTFCLKCLWDLARQNHRTFLCPECRFQVKIPREGVASFQTNFYISATDLERARTGNGCASHPSQDLNLFCEDCQQILCITCLEAEHKNHKFKLLQAVLIEFRDSMAAEQRNLEEASAKVTKLIDSALEDKNAIEASSAKMEAAIHERYALTMAMVQASRDRLINSFHANYQAMQAEITDKVAKMECMLDRVCQLQDFIKNDMGMGAPSSSRILEVVQLKNTLQKDMEDLDESVRKGVKTRPQLNFSHSGDLFQQQLKEVLDATVTVCTRPVDRNDAFASVPTIPEEVSD